MKLLTVLAVVLADLQATLGVPAPPPEPQCHAVGGGPAKHYLRAYAPNQPWHNRWLVQLPTTGFFGLENFTIHPPNQGPAVTPVRVPGDDPAEHWQLRLASDGGKPAYVTAFDQSNGSNHIVSVGAVFACESAKSRQDVDPSMRPEGNSCVNNAWKIMRSNAGDEAVEGEWPYRSIGRLTYGSFGGHWQARKDAPNSEGWQVYWQSFDGPGTPLEIDVVLSQSCEPEAGDQQKTHCRWWHGRWHCDEKGDAEAIQKRKHCVELKGERYCW